MKCNGLFAILFRESSVDDDVFGAINAHLDIKAQVGQKFKDLHHYVQQGFTNAIGSIVENIQVIIKSNRNSVSSSRT